MTIKLLGQDLPFLEQKSSDSILFLKNDLKNNLIDRNPTECVTLIRYFELKTL